MSIQHLMLDENASIVESERQLVEAGVIDETQHSVYQEASPQDLTWLPTEDQQ